jgi:hypothetical protein
MSHNAILYVFYGSPLTCAGRLKVYRELNPEIALYGICTAGIKWTRRFRAVEEQLDDLWYLPDHDGKWCWNNLDKVVCHWFLERGRSLNFAKILVVDWDLLLLEPAEKWLAQVDDNEVKFIHVWENFRPEENYWTSDKCPEFAEFKTKIAFRQPEGLRLFSAFLFAYACSKESFFAFAASILEFPGYCEYRLPTIMFSAGLKLSGFNRTDTWERFANVCGISIPRTVIRREMESRKGFRMFHPVYEPYHNPKLDRSLSAIFRDISWWKTISRKGKNLIKRLQGAFSFVRLKW